MSVLAYLIMAFWLENSNRQNVFYRWFYKSRSLGDYQHATGT
ncbi:hypothetical protein AM1_E0117 (plasmid) [Acaryochloris marina MBIC11017]|uniref:Uncharacterized protein n=1 Tax=Acaryochloris marina (strain MBIC 11017) TaxID=329726 RepID=A8ZPF0_ACAM1|nr:hypothetical protein AM1_E0117 [Acaryochloris marina MBIC11017]